MAVVDLLCSNLLASVIVLEWDFCMKKYDHRGLDLDDCFCCRSDSCLCMKPIYRTEEMLV